MFDSLLLVIDPYVGGALVAGGASLLGGLFTNRANAGESHAQRQWAAEQNHMDRAWQQHMTDYVNEYNTPANQRARLEAAGLNPYMMMDTGNTGTAVAASGAQHSAAPSAIPFQNPVPSNFSDALLRSALVNSQKDNLDAQSQKFGAEAKYSQLKGWADIISTLSESKLKSVQAIGKELENNLLKDTYADRVQNAQLVNKSLDSTIQQNMANTALLQTNTAFRNKELERYDEKFKQEMSLMVSQCFANRASANASYAQALLFSASEFESRCRAQGIRISNRVAEQTVSALVDRATYEAQIKKKEAAGVQLGKFGALNLAGSREQAKQLWHGAKEVWNRLW